VASERPNEPEGAVTPFEAIERWRDEEAPTLETGEGGTAPIPVEAAEGIRPSALDEAT
jgi:hypothetical protein